MNVQETGRRAPGQEQLGDHKPSALRRVIPTLEKYATLWLLIVLFVVFAITEPRFATTQNLTSLLEVQAVLVCVALASLLPLIVGEFDLSLGYAVGALSMLAAYLGTKGVGVIPILLAVFAGGAVIGFVNGMLAVRFRVSSFIATLGTGFILTGITQGLSGGQVLYKGIPPLVTNLANETVAGLAVMVWIAIILAVVLGVVLQRTPFGRLLYAIGASERVSYLAGVPTARLRLLAFMGAGVLVAVGALFQLGQAGAADPTVGPDLLLPAYAAAFLGVTSFRPGYFNVPGAMVAILLLAVGFNGLSFAGVAFWVQPIFNGAALLVAVLSARAESRRVRVG